MSIFISFLLLNVVFLLKQRRARSVRLSRHGNKYSCKDFHSFVCYSRVNWLKLSRCAAAGRFLSAFIKLVDDSNSKARKPMRLQLFHRFFANLDL